MYTFHVTLHARPADASEGPAIELAGRRVTTLSVAGPTLSATAMAISFEDARQRLSSLPRMYSEPDGSFVWVSSQGQPAWQVDGNLYDLGQRLLFVDLKGTCPSEAFDQLLKTFGWPETRIIFQLTREAVFLDEAEFRRHAESRSPGTPGTGE